MLNNQAHDLTAQGWELANNFCYEDAIRVYNQALQLEPNNPDILILRAGAFSHLEQYEQALEDVNQALIFRADNHQLWLFHGIICHALEKYKKAYCAYEKVWELENY